MTELRVDRPTPTDGARAARTPADQLRGVLLRVLLALDEERGECWSAGGDGYRYCDLLIEDPDASSLDLSIDSGAVSIRLG